MAKLRADGRWRLRGSCGTGRCGDRVRVSSIDLRGRWNTLEISAEGHQGVARPGANGASSPANMAGLAHRDWRLPAWGPRTTTGTALVAAPADLAGESRVAWICRVSVGRSTRLLGAGG